MAPDFGPCAPALIPWQMRAVWGERAGVFGGPGPDHSPRIRGPGVRGPWGIDVWDQETTERLRTEREEKMT